MADDEEVEDSPRAPRRPRQPIAAVVATLVAAAAIIGFSGYWFSDALGLYLHCNPPPRNTICHGWTFWGFSPNFFFFATIVGFVAGALLTLLAFVLLFNPRTHTLVGGLILACSAASVVAYGGYYVGIAAGVAGGILAILYRPPRFRELAQWSGRSAPRPGGSGGSGKRAPNPAAGGSRDWPPVDATPGPISPEVYDPLPPPQRSYRPPPGTTGRSQAAPAPSAASRYGSISDALRTPRPVSASPRPSAPSTPPPPLPAPPGTPSRSPPPTGGAPGSARPTGASARPVPSAKVEDRTAPAAPTPGSRPTATDAAASGNAGGGRTRPWKCLQCGLTNAPWSNSCTRCGAAGPFG